MRERTRASESSKEKLFCGPFEVLYDEMKRWLIESGWLKFLPSLVDLSYGYAVSHDSAKLARDATTMDRLCGRAVI